MLLNRPPRSKPSLPTPAATNRASTKSKKNSQPPQIRAHQLTWTLQRRRRYDRRGVRDQESDGGSGRSGSLGIIIPRARPAGWWGAGAGRETARAESSSHRAAAGETRAGFQMEGRWPPGCRRRVGCCRWLLAAGSHRPRHQISLLVSLLVSCLPACLLPC